MVTSVRGTENNRRGINQGSRADDGARTLVFGLNILVQQLPGEPVHCRLCLKDIRRTSARRRKLIY